MTRHWGVGSVYKRGTRYWISYSVNGKVYKESGGKTKAEARAKLQARKSEIFQGTFIGSHRAKVSINELLDSYVDHLKIEEAKSIDRVMSGLKTVRREFGHIRAVDLTTKMHKTFILKQQESGNANATINRRTQALRAAYNLALREESLSKIPHFTILKEDNVRQGFFEKDEFEAVLKHLPDPYNDIAEFAYYTGWRKGEILCLSWAQVDRNAKEIRLVTSKNGEGRVIPLQGKLLGLIINRWQKREVELQQEGTYISPLVFHRKGKPVGDIKKPWRKACKEAGYPDKLFHDFRRTAARNFIRAGVSESVAMSITGHKTNFMFQRYNITNMDDKRSAFLDAQEHLEGQKKNSRINSVNLELLKK